MSMSENKRVHASMTLIPHTGTADAIDRWFEDLQHYEATLGECCTGAWARPHG